MNDHIISFKVYFINGKYRYLYIRSLPLLYEYMTNHGIYFIRKIIFFFNITNTTLFPYKIHTITLDRLNGLFFHVIFNHYHNCQNKCIEIPLEQKQYDYNCLHNTLQSHNGIWYTFSHLITHPNDLLTT